MCSNNNIYGIFFFCELGQFKKKKYSYIESDNYTIYCKIIPS